MSSFVAALDAVEIRMTSPTGLVTVFVARQNETRITISEIARTTSDETVVAEEIERTVMSAWAEMKRQVEDVKRRRINFRRPDDGELHEWQIKFLKELEQITSEGESSGGLATVYLCGDGDLVVVIHKNAVRRREVKTKQLEMELEQALAVARSDFMRKMIELRSGLATGAK